uniref:Pyruvate dehydrogenase E1 component subunit alpha, mitochondrial n=1 Tax=Lygus hesperus TaxID=30085 RepID=A0A0A9Y4F4_LYGHE
MHIYNAKGRFYGGNGIVGAQVPLGTGIAFAHQYSKDNGVALAFFGDGAANQGQVFEAMNMAKLWKLPVIYVCENNRYAMGTSVDRSTTDKEFYKRYAMPSIWVDGLDALACRQGFGAALDWCRNGNGPIFLELYTYRYHGHSMSDPGISYRSRDEVNDIRKNSDCVTRMQQLIVDNNLSTEDEIAQIVESVRSEVSEQVDIAKKDPEPDVSQVYEYVYTNPMLFVRKPLTNKVVCPMQ